MRLDVCICTHSPRPEVLALAVAALARQSSGPVFEVLLVDNASTPPVPEAVLEPLRARGIQARIVREPVTGVASARRRAITETRGDWILFVDDDNELADDFVATGLTWVAGRADVASFGGRLLLGDGVRVPGWGEPFLPYLAVKDHGEEVITGASLEWGPWEPPTAGAFVRRDLAEAYLRRVAEEPRVLALGRKGRAGLASGEDALMMRQAGSLGLQNAYVPALSLRHHIDGRRLRVGYLLRFMWAFGASHVVLEHLLQGHRPPPPHHARLGPFLRHVRREISWNWKGSWPFALCMFLLNLGAWKAHRDAAREGGLTLPARAPADHGDLSSG